MTDSATLSPRRKMLILLTCCLSLFIVGLDSNVVNVALPTMGRDLDAEVSGLQWVIDAYTVVLASLLMLGGSTGDRFGRRKIFQIGLGVFVSASILCALAPTLSWLIIFRMMQAVGGSMLNPVAMSIITNVFTGGAERARAIGVWGGVVGLSQAFGPLIGGALTDSVGWRAIFWVNVPVGVAAIALTALLVPNSRSEHPRRFDPIGQLLVIIFLGALTYGIIEAPVAGWTSTRTLIVLGLSAAALVALLLYEPRRHDPLIEIGFFASAPFSGATMIAICSFAGVSSFMFFNVLYLQNLRGLSPFEAGLYSLPMAVVTAVLAPLSGRLVGSRGPRPSLIIAGIALTTAGFLLTRFRPDTELWQIFLTYVIFGIGFGMVNAPITNTAVSGMPRARAGVAAATASTSRQVGVTLGVAIAGTLVVTTAAHGPIPTDAGWVMIIVAGALVLALGVITTSRWARATAARTANRLGDANQ